jgi:hypothetical protein
VRPEYKLTTQATKQRNANSNKKQEKAGKQAVTEKSN